VLRRNLLWFLLGLAAGCSKEPIRSGPLLLVDDAGDTVRLAGPATRVASLAPSTTELLFAIGSGGRVVGRTRWCDWPVEAALLPSLGDGISPNVEAILGVRPDLVVLYRSPSNAAAATRLRRLGVPAIQLRTDSFDDLARNAELLGRALGASDSADAMIARLRAGLARLDRRQDSAGPRVLILAWDQPPMTIGKGSFQDELVSRAGGRNIFADIAAPSAPVSLEAIAARNPDAVLTTSATPAFVGRPEWRVVRAVRERRLVVMQGSEFSRPSPRAPAAIERLAAAFDSLRAPAGPVH
jgi:ABC-type Fe3+-hydroxamate transport system substrate-binding protein